MTVAADEYAASLHRVQMAYQTELQPTPWPYSTALSESARSTLEVREIFDLDTTRFGR